MSSLKRHEGYIMVDNRASPGLPEDIARAAGYDPEQCRAGGLFEAATLTCSHCGNAFVKNPLRTRPRPYCNQCDHYICDICDGVRQQPLYEHRPFNQMMDEVIEQAQRQVAVSDPPPILIKSKEY